MNIQKVLLIEKDPSLQAYLEDKLSTKEYEVHSTKNIREGVLTGIVIRPDIIFYNREVDHEAESFNQSVSTVSWLGQIPSVPFDSPLANSEEGIKIQRGLLLDSFLFEIQLQESLTEACNSPELRQGTGLTEILEAMALGEKSCRLSVQEGAESGEIFLDRGRFCGARTKDLVAEEALFRLLDMVDVQVKFDRISSPPRQVDPPSPVPILLEKLKELKASSVQKDPSSKPTLSREERGCLDRLVSLGFLKRRAGHT